MIFNIGDFQLGGNTSNFNNGVVDYLFTIEPNGVAGLGDNVIQDNFYKVERTDYSQNLPLWLPRKIITINGQLVGRTPEIFKQRKREFESLLRQSLTLYINDKTGSVSFANYQMSVRIIGISVSRDFTCAGKYQIQITSNDPFIYGTTAFDQTYPILGQSIVFPISFPFNFGDTAGTTVTNSGEAPIYPTFYLSGSGANWIIANQTTGKSFSYNGVIPEGQQVIITPQDNDPIKARLNGNSVNRYCTNFEALRLVSGDNILNFSVQDGIGANTSIRITFKPAFYGI